MGLYWQFGIDAWQILPREQSSCFLCLSFPFRLHSFRYGCCLLLILIYFLNKLLLNKSHKSLVAKLGYGKCGFLEVRGPQKSWRNNIRVRVRALTVMDIESHVRAGLPCGEVTERCEDQDKGKGLTVMDLALFCRCVLHRGRSVAVWTPLSAIDRNKM
jgi:hypothetical protein